MYHLPSSEEILVYLFAVILGNLMQYIFISICLYYYNYNGQNVCAILKEKVEIHLNTYTCVPVKHNY